MININYRDRRPIFEQVKDGFRNLIISGVLKEGERMPSVRDLASQLAINPNTIQRAYRELEIDGYICTVPGKGSFVSQRDEAAEKRRAELRAKMSEIAREFRHAGLGEEELISLIRKEYDHDSD
ncbi:MAG: GntR family transcriptional regulator [Oscillospiraceae bacterium]|nr:GntR family transcriptional regulator [Oscillospiraceae bacterium]